VRITSPISRRCHAIAAYTAITLTGVLAACSSGDSTGGGPVVAGPSPATETPTTAATTLAGVTVAAARTQPSTPPAAAATLAPVPSPTTVATSVASTRPASGEYAPTPAPSFPDRSTPPPTGNGLPDGIYYGVVTGAAPAGAAAPSVSLTIYQLLTGAPEVSAAVAAGVGLDSDVYVPRSPSALRQIVLSPRLAISVAQPDKPDVSYRVSPAELIRLIGGAGPSTGAPPTYHYIPFPYLLTVERGSPTRLEQLWSQ
jgi:hypothetical protein